jgi:hypothetical protein
VTEGWEGSAASFGATSVTTLDGGAFQRVTLNTSGSSRERVGDVAMGSDADRMRAGSGKSSG